MDHLSMIRENHDFRFYWLKLNTMARITNEGIKGLVGNVIFYSVDGKNYLRSKGRKKTKSKKQGQNPLNEIFGIVSTYGSGMAKRMKPAFLFPFKLAVYNKVRGWMRNQYAEHREDENWPLSVKHSGMCQLNSEADLRDFLRADIVVSDLGQGKINFAVPVIDPKKDIKVPLRTMKINIKLIAVTSTFKDAPQPYSFCTTQFSFFYNDDQIPEQAFALETNAQPGDIAMAAIAIEYETSATNGDYLKDTRWLPAAIVTIGRIK